MRNAFSVGIIPELALYGTGGTYFLKDRYKWNLLVFKPEDEEPFAEHNPRSSLFFLSHSQATSKESQGRVVFAKGFGPAKAGSAKWPLILSITATSSRSPAPSRYVSPFLWHAGSCLPPLLHPATSESSLQSRFPPRVRARRRPRLRLVPLQV